MATTHRRTSQYVILSAETTKDLCALVNEAICQGWTITGMPFYGAKEFHQGLVKLEEVHERGH